MGNNETNGPIYKWEAKVNTYDADKQKRMTLSAILRYQQEAGELQLAEVGGTYETLYKDGIIFIITTLGVKINRYPKLNEKITIRTWHMGNKGIRFTRCYEILSKDGEILTEGKSVFVIIDPVTHKIQKPKSFEKYSLEPNREDITLVEEKFKMPEDMELYGKKSMIYSDIDYNGHLNNTKYADIINDYMPITEDDYDRDLPDIKEFHIKYIHEAKMNQKMDIYIKKETDKIYYKGITDKESFNIIVKL